GVEIFRDASGQMRDLERARTIQSLSMQMPPDDNPRLRFAVKYLPHDMIGGDFYTVEKLDQDRYAFCIVDVMGHGTAAGLYAMHLHSLWEANRRLLDRPASFVSQLNKSLCQLVRDGESFATGLFGYIDLRARAVGLCAAGSSPSFLLTRQARTRRISLAGLPLGLIHNHVYEVTFMPMEPGDGLLLFTDGATEITNSQDAMLGNDGMSAFIDSHGFPDTEGKLAGFLEKMLKFSNSINFVDDVTMLAIHCPDYPARHKQPGLSLGRTAG
ncbi:MAG: PP2C family protein-serine/threonine phosphatase, partial [Pseudomonadota bacterium]